MFVVNFGLKMMDLNSMCFVLTFLSLIMYLLSRFRSNHGGIGNPCPQSYPLIGNIIGFLLNRHRFHDWVTDMISESPSLTIQVNNGFLGLSHIVCTAHPSNLEQLLRSKFSNYVKGIRFQSVLSELLGNGIFNVDGQLWYTQRKISSHEFTTNSLKYFVSDTIHSQLSTRLIPHLSSACHNHQVIDLQDVLRKFTFNNICNVAFGVDPENNDNTSAFVHAFDYAVEISSNRLVVPLQLVWKIKRLLNIGSEKKLKEAIRIIDDYAMKIIRSKEQSCREADQESDLLSRFMYSSSNVEFRDEDEKRRFLRDIVISFILAGKDSTSTALTWFFWLISGHPQCKRLIHNELSSHGPGIFSYEKLKELNYLHAALSESLRLFPPIPINSRLAVCDDTLSSGTYVGKGWFADYSAYAMGRMESLWGHDCREFRPERWLDENGVFQPCDPFKFPVFHCGPRMCLGKEMAYVQMKSIAAAVMHEFEVVAVDGGGLPHRITNPPYDLSVVLKMKGGLPVTFNRRSNTN